MTDKFLSQEEVDALLKGVTGEVDEPKPVVELGNVRPYDLATQERTVRGSLPTLELINERFAHLFRNALQNFLRRSAEVSAGPVRITKFNEFIRNLVVPTNLNLIHMKPLRGSGMIVLDPDLVFLLVDNFFGGDGRFQTRIEGREFTQTEQRTIARVLNLVFDAYAKAWEAVYPVEFEFLRSEVHAHFANIATPNEAVVAITFSLELGSVSGQMHICFPYVMIEPIRDILISSMQGEAPTLDQRWVQLMKQQIKDAEVEAVADLCTAPTTLRGVLNLQVGDVIALNLPKTIALKVDQVPVMECSYGQSNGLYALCVEKLFNMTGETPLKASHD